MVLQTRQILFHDRTFWSHLIICTGLQIVRSCIRWCLCLVITQPWNSHTFNLKPPHILWLLPLSCCVVLNCLNKCRRDKGSHTWKEKCYVSFPNPAQLYDLVHFSGWYHFSGLHIVYSNANYTFSVLNIKQIKRSDSFLWVRSLHYKWIVQN